MNRNLLTTLFVAIGLLMFAQSVMANIYLSIPYAIALTFLLLSHYIQHNVADTTYNYKKDKYLGFQLGVMLTVVGMTLQIGGHLLQLPAVG
jgi:hypothetical protein